jgi:hypothetical protein
MLPATFSGLTRRSQTLGIPTYIEEVYVKPPKGEMALEVIAGDIPKATLSGNVTVISEGEVVGIMRDLQLSSIGDYDTKNGEDPCAAVELEWKQDVSMLDASTLMKPAVGRTQTHKLLNGGPASTGKLPDDAESITHWKIGGQDAGRSIDLTH